MVCVVGTRLWDIMHILRKTSAECPTAVCQLYTPFLSVSVRVSNFELIFAFNKEMVCVFGSRLWDILRVSYAQVASSFPVHKRPVHFLCINCLLTHHFFLWGSHLPHISDLNRGSLLVCCSVPSGGWASPLSCLVLYFPLWRQS